MSRPRQPEQSGRSWGPASQSWSAELDRRLVELLHQNQSATDILDPWTARFGAVPLGPKFNKPRSNLLLRRTGLGPGCNVYLDADLRYGGSDDSLVAAMSGSSRGNWRQLRIGPVSGSVNEAFCSVLGMLGSPLAAPAGRLLRTPASAVATPGRDHQQPIPGRLLAAVGERITPPMAAEAYRSSVRRPLARQLALLTTRQAAPHSAVLWGPSGAGRDQLMVAAAAPLFEAGHVDQVYRLRGAMLAAGCVLAQELDAALMGLLTEVASLRRCLLLVQDVDLCLSGSSVGDALLEGALDRGLRMLATVRDERFVDRLEHEQSLARRLVALRVPGPRHSQTIEILEDLARAAGIQVAPPAIQAAARIAQGPESGQPATAVGLLSAALAEAAWEGRTQVGPDDVVAAYSGRWSQARAAAPSGPEDEGEDDDL